MIKFAQRILSGKNAENQALSYLKKQGLSLIKRNYRSYYGEIDLIMLDQEIIVFIEVRKRTCQDYGNSIESVNRKKQQKIIKTALIYLQQKKLLNKKLIRFDIIGIDKHKMIKWIKNAFQVE